MVPTSLLQTIFFLLLGTLILVALISVLDWVRVLLPYSPAWLDDQHHSSSRGAAVRERMNDPRQPLIVGPTVHALTPTNTTDARVVVGPAARAVWNDRGWSMRFDRGRLLYQGFYGVTDRHAGQHRAFLGRIVIEGRYVAAYIADPPAAIKRHPKGACFMRADASWFRIHWHRPAQNVDDALLYIERVLDEALNQQRQGGSR